MKKMPDKKQGKKYSKRSVKMQPNQVGQNHAEERLEGRNPIQEALNAGRMIDKLWYADRSGHFDGSLAKLIKACKERGTSVLKVERQLLDQMSVTNNHQGLIAQVAAHDYTDFDHLIANAFEKSNEPMLLLLDELKDSYNLGSILRIADAAGIHGVVIPHRRSVSLNAAVARISAGALEHVPVAKVTNITQTLLSLKEKGFWVVGTDAGSDQDYHDIDWKGPMAIVIGSEGEGLGSSVQKHCDFLVSIGMHGKVNSLNAAVATGIIVFEAIWKREGNKQNNFK